jgi:ubiquinone/menaquinone biosynthesis C-methylase UbiE
MSDRIDPALPDSIAANVAEWTETNAQFTDAQAERAWKPQDLTWGVFGVPEDAIGSPLGDVNGLDVVELGCGTAYFSAQLAMRGARPVGVDPTPAQLATAARMMERTGISFPLVQAPGEAVPLPDASFDLAFSEFGASLWADPAKWIP